MNFIRQRNNNNKENKYGEIYEELLKREKKKNMNETESPQMPNA